GAHRCNCRHVTRGGGAPAVDRLANSNSEAYNPLLPSPYACSKKSAAVCLTPGSPGPACCGRQCVDTTASADHCGSCNKVWRHDRSTCCGGRCVDLLSGGHVRQPVQQAMQQRLL
ncbi:unnamed protein product, partial [Urochloa humidicola]